MYSILMMKITFALNEHKSGKILLNYIFYEFLLLFLIWVLINFKTISSQYVNKKVMFQTKSYPKCFISPILYSKIRQLLDFFQ